MDTKQQGQAILDRIAALPDNTWTGCPNCRAVVHRDRLREQFRVCSQCGHHFRLSASERLELLTDPGSFDERDADMAVGDPLRFTDRKPYPRRLDTARAASGLADAAVCGTARIGGNPVVVAVLDFAFLGGSMGSVVGEKITRAAEWALEQRVPLVTVASSGGARMQEGILSLLQMSKTAAAVGRLRRARVPFVSVLTDPVYGGVAASFAALGDLVIAETGTRAGFAGPQVIEQTIRQKLPKGFQTAGFLAEHGHIDLVADRSELPGVLRELVAMAAAAGRRPTADPGTDPEMESQLPRPRPPEADAWEAVKLARTVGRPTTLDYIERIFTGFLPLHGDRWAGDDQAIVGGPAWLGDTPVMVVGTCKGKDTPDNVRRNFGMPHPSGYRKAMRLFALAERFGIPVVTFVDTPGAYPGIRAEQTNQSLAIAEALVCSAGVGVPVVNMIIGEGGSGGALALATGDRLLVQENTVYSVISPEGCATILFGDAGRAPEAARALRLHAPDLYRLGVADELVAEPEGGSHRDPRAAADALAASLRRNLAGLCLLDVEELVERRYQRLRSYGLSALPGQDTGWWPDVPRASGTATGPEKTIGPEKENLYA